jgi:hypothetical protein
LSKNLTTISPHGTGTPKAIKTLAGLLMTLSCLISNGNKGKQRKGLIMDNGFNELRRLALETLKKKHPNFPDQYFAVTKYTDKDANSLTRAICDFIRFKGGQAERINTTGIYRDNSKVVEDVLGYRKKIGSGYWTKGQSTPGSADIAAVINGKAIKIEVKHGKDRLSEVQKQYQKDIESAGGVYYVAKDFQSFYQWFNEMEVKLWR